MVQVDQVAQPVPSLLVVLVALVVLGVLVVQGGRLNLVDRSVQHLLEVLVVLALQEYLGLREWPAC